MSADDFKAKGNAAFSAKNFSEAVECFSQGIQLDGSNHVLFSNRSASYAGLKQFDKALEDADKCISLKPNWGKGYGRKGAALHGMGDLDSAVEAYKKGLEVEPGLPMLTNGLKDVEAEMAASGDSFGINNLLNRPDLLEFVAKSPTLSPFLVQPDFPELLQELKNDKAALGKHLNDQRVQLLLQELLRESNPNIFKKAEEDEIRRRKEKEAAEEAKAKKEEEEAKRKLAEEAARKAAMTEEDFKDDPKGLSDLFKDKGNAAYKAKNFDEAISLYTKAYEANSENITVLTNRAAVKFEQKAYDDCIADCKKAIEEGRACRADWKIIARAFERMGNAYVKQDKLDDALAAYNDSLVENRTPAVEKKLRETEKALKEQTAKAYLNPEKAAEEKEKGNALVKEGKWIQAKEAYDEAIRRNPKDHTIFSNRALCFMKLMEWPAAKADCDKALEIEPTFVRALERRGNCFIMLKEQTKALADFRKGLEIDPSNQGLLSGIQRVESTMFSGQRDPDAVANAMKDPEIQQILQDPVISNVLRDLQNNPAAAQDALKDPVIADRIQKLAAAGILSFG